ncbi:MAG: hypothetical protein ACI9U2_001809 [Bradymonadia bacterium]|jgi:hypothetical protein
MNGQYEFSGDENAIIRTLASKMGTVGFFLMLVGLGLLVLAALGFLPTVTDTLPALPAGLPPEVVGAVERYTAFAAQSQMQAYYGALASGLQAIILLLSGVYVRRASGSFRKIVNTEGEDISHLLTALGALRGLFSLLATLLILTLIIALGVIGLRIYAQMNGF